MIPAENGLNVLEKEKLEKRILQLSLTDAAVTYAGADEVLCTMISHWLTTCKKEKRTLARVAYALPAAEFCQSRYEGQKHRAFNQSAGESGRHQDRGV